MPPHTTTAKVTTRLQNKYHPETSEIELYGSPTTKDLKKPHSSRWVGEAALQKRAERQGEAVCGREVAAAGPTFTCGR